MLAETIALLALSVLPAESGAGTAPTMTVYVGTYSRRGSQGIYRYQLDMKTGQLSGEETTPGVINPSFLAIHPTGKYLYSVSEVETTDGQKTGGISAFQINPKSGSLTLLNQEPSGGPGPCHVSVDRSGSMVMAANYGGGSVASMPLAQDGSLLPRASFIQHEGSSVDPARQQGPHAHSINVDRQNRFAVAADLGLDKILVYRIDPKQGTLTPNDPPFAKVPPGGGPRHFAFHPTAPFAYTNNEMTSTVTAFRYDGEQGILNPIQTVTTLPDSFDGSKNSTAEIQVHPSGRFLYVSNRGHHSIARFSIDPKTGMVFPMGHTSTEGETPRNFGIDPTGRFLLAANQDTDSVVVFRIDQETGDLTPTGSVVHPIMPVCVRFWTPSE